MKIKLMTVVMLVIIFFTASCKSPSNNYKSRKCNKLDEVFEELDYKDYDLNNWNLIKDCIIDAKSKIMLCDKKEQINEIYDETISKINQIEKSENKFNILNFKQVDFPGYASFGDYKKSFLINSYDELNELFNNKNIFDDSVYNSFLDNFSPDYFIEKTILVYFYEAGNSNIKRYINEVSKYNNLIKIQMYWEENENVAYDDLFVIPFILEFNKNDILSIDNIEFYEMYKK